MIIVKCFFNTFTGTHDIQNISVLSDLCEIHVSGNVVVGSPATGALIIVYSLTNDSDVLYISTDQKQHILIKFNISDLSGPDFGVSVFALEDGVPFERAATLPHFVVITGNKAVTGLRLCAI